MKQKKKTQKTIRVSVNMGQFQPKSLNGKKAERKEKLFEEIMSKMIPNLLKTINPHIQEVQ